MLRENYDFVSFPIEELHEPMDNKLFCTFSTEEGLESLIKSIRTKYSVVYNKIFVLEAKEQNEFVVTYNLDLSNVSGFLENTILVHRKKVTRTLYTINALNLLIKELNEGVLDNNFPVNWDNYKNFILLTKDQELRRIDTKLFKVIDL